MYRPSKLRILRLGLYLLWVPTAFMLLAAMLLVRPFVDVRLFVVPLRMTIVIEAARIRALREKISKPQVVLAYDEDPQTVNQSLAHHLGVFAGWRRGPRMLLVVARYLAEKTRLTRYLVTVSPGSPHDDVFWHQTYEYRPSLSPSEEKRAAEGLMALGITESTRAVAILTRDSAFFKSFSAPDTWQQFHSYRDCRIENYSQSVEYLHRQGFRSVRVGRISDNFLAIEPEGFVDYSASAVQSDLMDLVLATRCEFIITCSSGLDALYWLCGKPFIGVNLPWLDGKFANFSLCLPKRMFVESEDQLIELPLIAVTSPRFTPRCPTSYRVLWDEKPIVFRENSSVEILETIQLALAMQADPDLAQARRAMVAPLWAEFNARTASSNLHADARVRIPAMPLPDSVIARFLEAPPSTPR